MKSSPVPWQWLIGGADLVREVSKGLGLVTCTGRGSRLSAEGKDQDGRWGIEPGQRFTEKDSTHIFPASQMLAGWSRERDGKAGRSRV